MTKAWMSEKIQITKLHDQILQIFFPMEEEANRIVDQGPWCFDKDLLIVKPRRYGEANKVEDFYHTSFWIHIKGLPLKCYTKDMEQKIGKNFSGCSVIQIRENLDNGGRFFRMSATVNILKPLRRTIVLRGPDEGHIYALLWYEKLPIMCFNCGIIGHIAKKCIAIEMGKEMHKIFNMEFG
ncbi:uncharacterized protein [Coffea arabica]|uniref:CCHC-type domain-containing protein n=1 Tax=Coffea arabica TaxID=13443 RepID=A0ABM4VMH2_COFAR